MVGYLDGGKGWLSYDPSSRTLLQSAVARFPLEEGLLNGSVEPVVVTAAPSPPPPAQIQDVDGTDNGNARGASRRGRPTCA